MSAEAHKQSAWSDHRFSPEAVLWLVGLAILAAVLHWLSITFPQAKIMPVLDWVKVVSMPLAVVMYLVIDIKRDVRSMRSSYRVSRGHCPMCNYDLGEVPLASGAKCTECGWVYDELEEARHRATLKQH